MKRLKNDPSLQEEKASDPPKPPAGRKKYTLEARYVGKQWWVYNSWKEWHLYRHYSTEKARDTALESLSKKNEGWYEYRVKEDK